MFLFPSTLPTHPEEHIIRSVRSDHASTKADVVRRALTRLMEEDAASLKSVSQTHLRLTSPLSQF